VISGRSKPRADLKSGKYPLKERGKKKIEDYFLRPPQQNEFEFARIHRLRDAHLQAKQELRDNRGKVPGRGNPACSLAISETQDFSKSSFFIMS
jgi:hypothetical protein